MDREPGICPSCRDEGEVGAPCPERGCRARGYHFIPRVHATQPRLDGEIGLLLEGRYLLADRLGEGGFGKVFVALDLKFETKVALKLLKTGPDPEAHEKRTRLFELEAKVLARLSHPNIVQLKGFGVFEGEPYIVLEYIEGGRTLAREVTQRARDGKDIGLAEVEAILAGVLFGLEEAHQLQIVHRDIKPENVMLQAKPGHPVLPRILDFGIAKLADATAQSSAITGTPDYMAPEQVSRGEIGPWTDLYALGVMAFELMLGRRPFTGDLVAILSAKCDRDFDPLASVADLDLRPPIRAFLKKALAFEPRDRFRSSLEFRRAMQAAFAAAEGAGRRSVSVSDLVTADRLPMRPAAARRRARAAWILPVSLIAAAALGAGVVFIVQRPGEPPTQPMSVADIEVGQLAGDEPDVQLAAPEVLVPEPTRVAGTTSAPDTSGAVSAPEVRDAPDAGALPDVPQRLADARRSCVEACTRGLDERRGLALVCPQICGDPTTAPHDETGFVSAAEARVRAVPFDLALGAGRSVAARWTPFSDVDGADVALTFDAAADLGAFAIRDSDGRNVVLATGTRLMRCEGRTMWSWAANHGAGEALAACLRVRPDESGEWLPRALALAEPGAGLAELRIKIDSQAPFVRSKP